MIITMVIIKLIMLRMRMIIIKITVINDISMKGDNKKKTIIIKTTKIMKILKISCK